MMEERTARIMDIRRVNFTSCVVTQGIKKGKQSYYNNSPFFNGSNGTYSHDYETETSVIVKLCIYETPTSPKAYGEVDIRGTILAVTGKKKVSAQRLEFVKKNNIGRKVKVNFDPITQKLNFIDPIIIN
jgi:hypothetical protein